MNASYSDADRDSHVLGQRPRGTAAVHERVRARCTTRPWPLAVNSPVTPRPPRRHFRSEQCTTIPLISVAPALAWLYRAGAVTLAFLIFAIPPSAMATWLTLRRRTGTLRAIAVQGALGDALRGVIVTPVLHGVTCLFLIVAFASFAGATSSSFNATDFRASVGVREWLECL